MRKEGNAQRRREMEPLLHGSEENCSKYSSRIVHVCQDPLKYAYTLTQFIFYEFFS